VKKVEEISGICSRTTTSNAGGSSSSNSDQFFIYLHSLTQQPNKKLKSTQKRWKQKSHEHKQRRNKVACII
jgi:hypothetical protein